MTNICRTLIISLITSGMGVSTGHTANSPDSFRLSEIPPTDSYCLEAQRIVTRTNIPMELVVHDDFDKFVKSKAVIEGPQIQQFNWYDQDKNLLAISCKMKNTDHLQLEFGADAAGPDGLCQDMNYQAYKLLLRDIPEPKFDPVIFDLNEQNDKQAKRNQSGPEWLMPFEMTYLDSVGGLHVATKGFIIDFGDPRFEKFPPSWRGTHYCHLIAPDYLANLLTGTAKPGAMIGRKPKRGAAPPTD